jgi:NADH:ubiquinone oxidoreductase subunit E
MNTNQTLKNLLNIAQSQQKMIEKLAKISVAQELKGYLDRALAAAVANAGITSPFHGELQGNAYSMFFTQAPDNAKKTQLLTNLNNFIKANRPQLEGQITFKFV